MQAQLPIWMALPPHMLALLSKPTAVGLRGLERLRLVNPDGSGSGVLELLGDVVAPGTLSTNALTVGLGQNLLSNTDFSDGLNGWVTYKTGGGGNVNLSSSPCWRVVGGEVLPDTCSVPPSILAQPMDIPTSGAIQNWSTVLHSKGAPVEAGEWIEVSVKASSHRCRFELRIHFVNKAR